MATTSITNTSNRDSFVVNDALRTEPLNYTDLDFMSETMCVMMNFSSFPFHDETKDVVSTKDSNIINNVCHAIIIPALFIIGFPMNVLNMVVFYKHGLNHRINLCLFCLSLTDLLFLIFIVLMYCEKLYEKDLTVSYRRIGYLTQFLINNNILGLESGFGWFSPFVSAVISVERCVCVAWPLHAGTIFKTKTIGVILLLGFLFIMTGRCVVAEKYHVVCMIDVMTGAKSLQIISSDFYITHKNTIDILESMVFGLGLIVTIFGTVIITTTVTAIKLQKSIKFKRESSSASYLSAREVAVTRMLIYLSIQFIVLYTPSLVFRIFIFFLPEVSPSGNWANLYFFMIAVVELGASLNSSLNVLVYYVFGSKYRETVHGMLCRHSKIQSNKSKEGDAVNKSVH